MKKIFCFILLASCTIHASKTIPDTSVDKNLAILTIDEAIKEAFKNKPSIQALNYAITDLRRQRKTVFSSYLPNISLSETFPNTRNASAIKSSFGIEANQTLLNLSKRNSYKISTASIDLARHQKEAHKDDIRLATETSFLQAWLQQQRIDSIMLLYQASKETFDKTKHQYALELLNKNDWLKANVAHSQNLAVIDSYRDDVSLTEQTLAYYTGIKRLFAPSKRHLSRQLTKLAWDPHQEIAAKRFSYYYKQALMNRKDLRQKDATITSESQTSKFYANQYIPTVGLSGSATKNTLRRGNSSWGKSASLNLSWNVFDGLSNYFNKTAADARKMKAVLEKNDLTRQVKLEVRTAYTALQTELKKLMSQNVSYHQSQNEFSLRKQEFESDLISNVTYQEAKSTHETARFAWLNQVAITALKKFELLHSCGYPDKISINT